MSEDAQTPYLLGDGEYQKIYNLALKGADGERQVARHLLKKRGLYLDKADILWSETELLGMLQSERIWMFGEDPLV